MAFKKRDPLYSKTFRVSWKPAEPCPCGSLKKFIDCCLLPNGMTYRQVRHPLPPGPVTGYSHPRCYLNGTKNCSTRISLEHYISESVLHLIDSENIKFRGAHWRPADEIQEFSVKKLGAKILCERHNTALSVLDETAAQLFGTIRRIADNMDNEKTLSRKAENYLISGEELELWLIKTAFGLYNAGHLRQRGGNDLSLNADILAALQGAAMAPACGLYIMADDSGHVIKRHQIDVSRHPSTDGTHMVGLSFAFMGLTFMIALDHQASYRKLQRNFVHRPSYIQYRNAKRRHTIMLTWPNTSPGNRRVIFLTKTRSTRLGARIDASPTARSIARDRDT